MRYIIAEGERAHIYYCCATERESQQPAFIYKYPLCISLVVVQLSAQAQLYIRMYICVCAAVLADAIVHFIQQKGNSRLHISSTDDRRECEWCTLYVLLYCGAILIQPFLGMCKLEI